MIKGISPTGRYTIVAGGQAPSTYINNYSGAQGIGNMRYNTASQNYEVYDGNNWMPIGSSYATVGLSGEAEELLDWARIKRDEEMRLKKLADKHPGIADLIEQRKALLENIDSQIEMFATLTDAPENKEKVA